MAKAIAPKYPLISDEEMSALMRDESADSMQAKPIEIILADPHPVVLDGLRQTFERTSEFHVNTCVHDGAAAWEDILKFQPDIVVMELTLRKKDSLSLINDLKEERLKTLPVIFTQANIFDVWGVMAVGVNGLVSKSKPKEILMKCIREVHQGQKWFDDEYSVCEWVQEDAPLTRSIIERLLTLRELSIVQLVLRGRSNREIANTFSIAEGTVKVHLKHIYRKLKCQDRIDLLSKMQRDV